ncbi:hypothetical protein MP228_010399 [Amoeboaphelidium protococcarum]|nr:hypothetical protein MP228_010399 [Amoeboaphelidium protococcarum]
MQVPSRWHVITTAYADEEIPGVFAFRYRVEQNYTSVRMSNNQSSNSKKSKVQFNGLNHSRWSRALKTEMQELEVSAVVSQDASNRIVSLPTADDLLVMELAQFDNSGAVIPANDKKAYIKCVKSLRQMDQKAQAILIQSLQEGKMSLVCGATRHVEDD